MRTRVTHDASRWRAALRFKGAAATEATRRSTGQAIRLIERSTRAYLSMRGHPAGTPTPAPPGSPPAMVSGALMRSVRASRVRRAGGKGRFWAQSGPRTAYGRAQELGYPPRHLAGRPFQKPVTRRQLAKIRRIYRDGWAEAMRA